VKQPSDTIHQLPVAAGGYLLWLWMPQGHWVSSGALGTAWLARGWYGYVGSAAAGLRGRMRHHLQPLQHNHWHIDYLRHYASVREIWYCVTEQRLECLWADALATCAKVAWPRFGASDCHCHSHLFTLPNRQRLPQIAHHLATLLPQPLQRLPLPLPKANG
jgi:Uri superfamily endonuclease